MSGWQWVNKRALLLLHDESLAEHGGASGLRDEGLLDSALARPLNCEPFKAAKRGRLLGPNYLRHLIQIHALAKAFHV